MRKHKKSKLKPVKPVKKRNKEATQAALIQAATQLFALKGYDATRTLEIAQKAKVNEALITRYFGGKSGLLVRVLQDDENQKTIINSEAHCPASGWIPSLDQAKNLREAMKEFFVSGAAHLADKQEFIRIGLSQALVDSKMGLLLKTKTLDKTVPKVLEGLKVHIKKNKFSKAQLESLAMLLISVNFTANFLGRFIHQIDDQQINALLDLVVDTMATRFE